MGADTYWARRSVEREEEWTKKSHETVEKELAAHYERSAQRIQAEIERMYGKFAADNGVSITEARKLIDSKEFRTWRKDVEEYIDEFKKTGNPKIMLELNTLSMRSRISRLDKLYGDTLIELDKLGQKTDATITGFLKDSYKDNRLHSAYELAKRGQGPLSVAVDNKQVEQVLRTPWSGKNYSERIWKNSDKLASTIQDTISNGVHRGVSVDKLAKEVQERMGVSKNDAVRLVRTEMNYVNNQAALDSIRDAKMKYFQFIATLDKRTSSTCREHDGKIFPIDDAEVGNNVPPLHPRCRSTIAGTLGPAKPTKGSRTAKEVQKTKGEHVSYRKVPRNMEYEDWKAVYVDNTKTLADWQNERKQYSSLPDNVRNKAIPSMPAKTEKPIQLSTKEEANNFMAEKYGMPMTKAHLKKIDETVYTKTVEQLAKLDSQYDVLNGFAEKSFIVDAKRKAIAYVQTRGDYNLNTIALNYQYMTSVDWISNVVERNQGTGFFMNCDEDSRHLYPITHEFGHIVHNDYNRKNIAKAINGNVPIDIAMDNFISEFALSHNMSFVQVLEMYVSRYGQSDSREMFAELFAHVNLSKHPNKLGVAFKEWLKENGYG